MTPKKTIRFILAVCTLLAFSGQASATSRIKDLADVEGIRENLLVGYGLVVGLDGTGDSLTNAPFTRQSLTAMLERLGVNTRGEDLNTENVAAVMVTANLPPFSTQGTRIDVGVSALGDAESLRGGTLLVTPLHGADGEIYAVGQGPVAVGGFTVQGDGGSVRKGVATAGRISNGAIIERELPFNLARLDTVRLALRNPDFTTARRIEEAVNAFIAADTAIALDPATVRVSIPTGYKKDLINLLTDIEQLRVEPDLPAKVVIDENLGIIVMGANVRVNEVAIAQGSLTIRVTEQPQVSQPNPFSETGETVVVPRTTIEIEEDENNKLTVLQSGVSLQVLVDGLNALGVGPRDMISILQTIKAAGALQAEIEVI
ncbi:MAG: flagellar basal body P-ring protein FlgI [Pseudomonadota bacterium]